MYEEKQIEALLTLTTSPEWKVFKEDVESTLEAMKHNLTIANDTDDMCRLQGRIQQLRIMATFDDAVQTLANEDEVEGEDWNGF